MKAVHLVHTDLRLYQDRVPALLDGEQSLDSIREVLRLVLL